MGCGGSRADAIIEPRYHESWTRETESTWLTNTDIETPLPVASSNITVKMPSPLVHNMIKHLQMGSSGEWLTQVFGTVVLQGKALEAGLREKRTVNTGTQCGKQALTTAGSNHQRRARRSLSDQTARDSKRRASKEANVASKDGPGSVNVNSGEDAEPGNVCDER
ncbi:putative brain and acute leukemia cytoplasmic protein-like [Scophthalmus maximus]|uniref:Putative brain and acute leukemia cytoplasmic protein-like n=1 Tax=Scophthalmus maximus TaxID=52904 RepID=A0A2U9CYG4_SCOMX|nr:putative brain and acute leukemia cytoplasmic protein-like [Scophthalmus maximus]